MKLTPSGGFLIALHPDHHDKEFKETLEDSSTLTLSGDKTARVDMPTPRTWELINTVEVGHAAPLLIVLPEPAPVEPEVDPADLVALPMAIETPAPKRGKR